MSEWKETEVGVIPQRWKCLHIGDFADVTKLAGYEYTKHITYVGDGETIALRALNVREGKLDLSDVKRIYKSVSDDLPRSKLVKDDILFTYVGANIGQFALIPENEKFHLAPNICRIRCGMDCDPYFLFSYFRTSYFRDGLEGFCHGSSQPTLPMKNIRKIPAPVPPLPEQKTIVKILSSLDDKIDLLHRQNKTLEQMAETLFRQWFAEEAGKGWRERPLSSIASFLNGLACQKFPPKNEVDKLPVLKIKQLRNGFSTDSDWCTTDVKPEYVINNGDVIFSWSASLMVKIWNGSRCILNQHLFKVSSEEFPKWFYYLWSKHHLDEFISISSSHATTMGHIKRGDLDAAMVLVPSPVEIVELSELFTPLVDKIITNNKKLKNMEALRDVLLPKLMSGEVRVLGNG